MRKRPMFNYAAIPESEHSAIRDFESALDKLDSLVKEFGASFELLSLCENSRNMPLQGFIVDDKTPDQMTVYTTLSQWENIARKNGALILYDVYQHMSLGNKLYSVSEYLKSIVNKEKLKLANKMFEDNFPGIGKLRNAAAHSGGDAITQDQKNKHASMENPFADFGIYTSGSYMEAVTVFGKYSWTVEDKVVSYTLSQKTAQKLNEIVLIRRSAFEVL